MPTVTLKDVAKVAGVSYATVSRALSGSPEIGDATRLRILKLCEEMGYTPNTVARSMVMKRTNIIGLIVASIDNPFMSEMIRHIERHVRECGYNLMICSSFYDPALEKEVFSLLRGRQVDGILIIPSGNESFDALKPFTSQVPTVFISDDTDDHSENIVTADNPQGGEEATAYLHSLGHRKILYFGCRGHSMTHRMRLDGYLNACRKLGITPEVWDSPFPRGSHEIGYKLALEYFSQKRDHTALLCASDSIAIGVMQAAYEHGILIPRDLSVMGFDNISFAALPLIDLTTMDQPKQRMASAAVDLLIERIQNPEAPHARIVVPFSLVERRSCCAVRS